MTNGSLSYPQFVRVVNEKNSFAICLPLNPTKDAIGAGLALYLALNKLGKTVVIVCESPIPQDISLPAVDKIGTKVTAGGDTLVISFPYDEGAVDKVTYGVEGSKFNITVIPYRQGYRLDPKQVSYTYSGGKVDAVICLDASKLESLGNLYTEKKDQFSGVDIINIDRKFNNTNFGSVNIVEKSASSISEIIVRLIEAVRLELDKDVATSLYFGLVSATNNFSSYSTTADTFEMASKLLKAGAIKKPFIPSSGMAGSSFQQTYQQPFTRSIQNVPNMQNQYYEDDDYYDYPSQQPSQQTIQTQQNAQSQVQSQQQPVYKPQTQGPSTITMPQTQQNAQSQVQSQQQSVYKPQTQSAPTPEMVSSTSQTQNEAGQKQSIEEVESKEAGNPQTPSEWLKPKIFKGSSLI